MNTITIPPHILRYFAWDICSDELGRYYSLTDDISVAFEVECDYSGERPTILDLEIFFHRGKPKSQCGHRPFANDLQSATSAEELRDMLNEYISKWIYPTIEKTRSTKV